MGAHRGHRWPGHGAIGAAYVLLAALAVLTWAAAPPSAAAGRHVVPVWRPVAAALTEPGPAAPALRGTGEYLTITAKAGVGTWIKPEGEVFVLYGAGQSFDYGAQTGYHVVDVVVDGTSRGPLTPPYEFKNVTADRKIEVLAAATTFAIAPAVTGRGTIEPSTIVEVPYGSSQKFTMTADAGYHLDKVLVDGEPVAATYLIGGTWVYTFENVAADHSIVASFLIDTRAITAHAGEGAWIRPEGRVEVPYGGSQTFDFGARPHYHVTDVIVDGKPGNAAATTAQFMGVTEDHSIEVRAARDTCDVHAVAGPHGSIAPSGDLKVPYGTDQLFVIKAEPHYHLEELYLGDHLVTAAAVKIAPDTWHYTLAGVAGDADVTASFALDTLLIQASCGEHGRIAPSGTVTVPYEGSVTFSLVPDAGYWPEVSVDNEPARAAYDPGLDEWSYTFAYVASDHTLRVTFTPGPPPDRTEPELTCRWEGEVLGRQRQLMTTVFTIQDEPNGSGASTDGSATVRRLRSEDEDKPLPVTPRVISPLIVDFDGSLPVDKVGTYVLVLSGSDRAGNDCSLAAYYKVAGVAIVRGAPKRIDLRGRKMAAADGGGAPGAPGPAGNALRSPGRRGDTVTLTLALRGSSGRPVTGARPRLFVYDETSGTCIFRAARPFRAASPGTYAYRWSPAQMTPDPARPDEWRDLQLVIPLDGEELSGDGNGAARGSVLGAKKPTKPTVAVTTVEARW